MDRLSKHDGLQSVSFNQDRIEPWIQLWAASVEADRIPSCFQLEVQYCKDVNKSGVVNQYES